MYICICICINLYIYIYYSWNFQILEIRPELRSWLFFLRNEEKFDQNPPKLLEIRCGLRGFCAANMAKTIAAQNYQLYSQKPAKKCHRKKHQTPQIRKSRRVTSLKVTECSLSNSYFLQQRCFQMQNVGQSVALAGSCWDMQ